jgi:hypothetical protein
MRFQVLTRASMKMAAFWVAAPCNLVEIYRRFRSACCLHHQGRDDLWNVGKFLPDDTAQQPRRQPSSYSPPWEPQILQPKSGKHVRGIDTVTEERRFSCSEKKRVRKYQTDFLTFGFTYQLVNGEEHPRCVVCGEVLATDTLNARNLRVRLTAGHTSLANKPL